jgi:small-conductance mechanosensitive channel
LSYELGIAPDADMNKARQLVLEAIQQLPFILKDPSPSVWVDNLAASSITLKATAWFNQRNTSGSLAKGEAINISKNALERAGIDLPEPTYRLIVNSDQTATQPKPTASKARKPKEQAVVVGNVEAKDQSALEKIITEERSETKGDDLLNKKAPEE